MKRRERERRKSLAHGDVLNPTPASSQLRDVANSAKHDIQGDSVNATFVPSASNLDKDA